MFNINLQEMKAVFDKFNLKDYLVHLQSNSPELYNSMFRYEKEAKDVCFCKRLFIGSESIPCVYTPDELISQLDYYNQYLVYSNNILYFYSRFKDYDFSLNSSTSFVHLEELDFKSFMKMYDFVNKE